MDNKKISKVIDIVIDLLSLHEFTKYGTIEGECSKTIFADMITNNLLATSILLKIKEELYKKEEANAKKE